MTSPTPERSESQILQRLSDREEIRDLMLRYARGINRQDWDLVLSCYHADAVEKHAYFFGPGSPTEYVQWLRDFVGAYETVQTFITNQLVEVYGDLAWEESYSSAVHRIIEPDGRGVSHLIGNVRYCIRHEKRDGEWRFSEREIYVDSGGIQPILGIPVPDENGAVNTAPAAVTGRFDKSDGSYDLRDRIRKDSGL